MKLYKQDFSYYTNVSSAESLRELETDSSTGLDHQEVARRRQYYGFNVIPSLRKTTQQLFLQQFKTPFIYLLFGACLISFLLRNPIEGFVILGIILVNAAIGFYQEYQADKSVKLLQKYLISYVRVIRNGQEIKLLRKELVPGDIILLYPGDIVPADARIIAEENFFADESIITGESIPIKKIADPLNEPTDQMFKALNILFAGSSVTKGKAIAVVFATGVQSNLGRLASYAGKPEPDSHLTRLIAQFSRIITIVMAISLLCIIIAHLIVRREAIDMVSLLLFSVALAVSVVPEALPIVITFALAQGALKLAQQKTIVKRLLAIEDLGTIQVLCCDKTGTLTENKLVIKEINNLSTGNIIFDAARATGIKNGHAMFLKGFERALFEQLNAHEKKLLKETLYVSEYPFDPAQRSSGVLIDDKEGFRFLVAGSFESIMSCCGRRDQNLEQWVQEQGRKGYRLLAVAHVSLPEKKRYSFDELIARNDLTLLGIIAFEDPLKKTAVKAIERATKFGIQCKIISGDAPEVCGAIAQQVGLIDDLSLVMTGEQFMRYSQVEQQKLVLSTHVFARVSPDQKYQIIECLQQQLNVGYAGDGINDVPALQKAHVGIATHDAIDVARQAADIIMLEKSLLVIINGIVEGRKIVANTIKYIRTTLAGNFGNFYALAIISIFIDVLPMLPLQILLVNILTDLPLIGLATDSVDNEQVEKIPVIDLKNLMVFTSILGFVSSIFDFLFFFLLYPISIPVLQTGWFMASVLTELASIFSLRTERFFFQARVPSVTIMMLSIGAAATALILPYTQIGMRLFDFVYLQPRYLGCIIALTACDFVVSDLIKVCYLRWFDRRPKELVP